MNKTANYNLNQWAAEDKVQRTDFNADNAKIDGALKALEQKANGKAETAALTALAARVAALENCRPVELGRIKLTAPTDRITFSLAGANLSRFRRLRLWTPGLSSTEEGITGVQINGVSTGYSYDGTDTLNPISRGYVHFTPGNGIGEMSIRPLGSSGTLFYVESVGLSYLSGHWGWTTQKDIPFSRLTKLELVHIESDGAFSAGSEVALYGMFDG